MTTTMVWIFMTLVAYLLMMVVIGAIYSKDGLIKYHQFKTGLLNVEQILASYQAEGFSGKSCDISRTVDYIINNFRRKMIIFIITDMKGMAAISDPQLKRLICRHDVLFVKIYPGICQRKQEADEDRTGI